MNQALNFRMSKETILTLNQLVNMLKISKTEIMEKAIMLYYEQITNNNSSPLHALAGSMNDADSNAILKTIIEDK